MSDAFAIYRIKCTAALAVLTMSSHLISNTLYRITSHYIISHHIISYRSSQHYDTHRFERVSNIIKQFKLSCSKTQSQFQGMEVRNSQFTVYIDTFTGNTYIMVITTGNGSKIPTTLTQLNIAAARKHFEKFIPENS